MTWVIFLATYAVVATGRIPFFRVPKLPDPRQAWLVLAMASTLAGNLTILGSIANLIVVEGASKRGVTVTLGAYARVGVPLTLATVAFGAWWLSSSTGEGRTILMA